MSPRGISCKRLKKQLKAMGLLVHSRQSPASIVGPPREPAAHSLFQRLTGCLHATKSKLSSKLSSLASAVRDTAGGVGCLSEPTIVTWELDLDALVMTPSFATADPMQTAILETPDGGELATVVVQLRSETAVAGKHGLSFKDAYASGTAAVAIHHEQLSRCKANLAAADAGACRIASCATSKQHTYFGDLASCGACEVAAEQHKDSKLPASQQPAGISKVCQAAKSRLSSLASAVRDTAGGQSCFSEPIITTWELDLDALVMTPSFFTADPMQTEILESPDDGELATAVVQLRSETAVASKNGLIFKDAYASATAAVAIDIQQLSQFKRDLTAADAAACRRVSCATSEQYAYFGDLSNCSSCMCEVAVEQHKDSSKQQPAAISKACHATNSKLSSLMSAIRDTAGCVGCFSEPTIVTWELDLDALVMTPSFATADQKQSTILETPDTGEVASVVVQLRSGTAVAGKHGLGFEDAYASRPAAVAIPHEQLSLCKANFAAADAAAGRTASCATSEQYTYINNLSSCRSCMCEVAVEQHKDSSKQQPAAISKICQAVAQVDVACVLDDAVHGYPDVHVTIL